MINLDDSQDLNFDSNKIENVDEDLKNDDKLVKNDKIDQNDEKPVKLNKKKKQAKEKDRLKSKTKSEFVLNINIFVQKNLKTNT